jgi:drug/metabolite transporter (DMT)-like permease
MPYLGETAGLLTSLFFAVNALIISKAATQVGSLVLNRTRLVFALLYLILLNLLFFGQPLPLQAGPTHWGWLALSGLIGFAIGDIFLFQAFIFIGPRLATLLLSLSTVFGALEALLFFGETLRLGQVIGITLALAGIVWVILERAPRPPSSTPDIWRHRSLSGTLFGILAAVGQATGLVFSRQGMQGEFSPIQGNVIRLLAAVLSIWFVTFVQRQAGSTVQTLREHPSSLKWIALAAFVGPVIGVSLSLLAVQNSPVGVASVLTSLSPILMLPFSYFFLKERLGWQPVAGTLLAMSGVAILFLS